MGLTRGLDGTEYEVPSIIGTIGNVSAVHDSSFDQLVTVASSIRKGTKWHDVSWWRKDWEVFMDRPEWKVVRVERFKDGRKRMHFQPILKPGKQSPDPQKVASLIEELKLTDENLKGMLRSMLSNVFVEKTLRKLLECDDMEFLMDQEWIYLRAGKTAYRV
jgi:hypothetical protein